MRPKQLASGSKTLAIKQASSKTVQRGPINSFWYHFVGAIHYYTSCAAVCPPKRQTQNMSLGLLSAASRICDDVNLLWSIAEVYNESTQKPRAHELLAGVLYALEKDAPQKRKRVQAPPVLAYVDEDDDCLLYTSPSPRDA